MLNLAYLAIFYMKFFDNQEIQTETIARNYYYYFCLSGKVLVFVLFCLRQDHSLCRPGWDESCSNPLASASLSSMTEGVQPCLASFS